jgi:hypothetical protein
VLHMEHVLRSIQTDSCYNLRISPLHLNLDLDSVKDVAKVLRFNQSVRFVSLSNIEEDADEKTRIIAEALYKHSSIRKFEIASFKIGKTGIEAIANLIKFNSSLKSIEILQNITEPECIEMISEALKVNKNLEFFIAD